MHVITGASSGIGRGIAVALGERGEPVLAVARRANLLSEIATAHVTPLAADVTTEAGRRAIVAAVGSSVVRSVVHGAGSPVELAPWHQLDTDRLIEHFRVHVAAPIALTQALLERGPVERMAILDSYSATTPRIGWSAYGTIKAAAQMSVRAAVAELPDTAVIRIFPGAVRSPLLEQVLADDTGAPAAEFYRSLEADGQVSEPLDIGRQIATLLVDEPLTSLRASDVWQVGHTA